MTSLSRSSAIAFVHRHELENASELEQRILRCVTRLGDLDTRSAAVADLEVLVRQLSPKSLSLFLVW
jgi:hypothetical protein